VIVDYNGGELSGDNTQFESKDRTAQIVVDALKANQDANVRQTPVVILSDDELVSYRNFTGVNARAYLKGSSLPQIISETLSRQGRAAG
jgi:hypothetical protein